MFKIFSSSKKPEEVSETATFTILVKSNEIFKNFLFNYSLFVYLIAGLLVLFCIFYYIRDRKRRLDVRRRSENFQRVNERQAQRRRPGGMYRDHEIFRNAIKTVRQYIGATRRPGCENKSLILKTTRSGRIYGSYSHNQ